MTLRQETLSEAPTEPIGVAPLVFLLALFLVLHTAIALNLDWSLAAHQYLGTDTYSRMVRVQDLMATGDWFDPTYRRVNPPYGHLSHWSRPMDAVILAETLLLATVMETADALYWAGATISPILHLLTLAIVVFGTRPLFGNTWAILCGLLFLVQPPITQTFMIGRPDHHSLQLFITAAIVVATFHVLLRPLDRRLCYLTGGLLAIGLWIGAETILTVMGVFGGLALAWLIWRGEFAPKGLHLSAAALVVMLIVLPLERGWSAFTEVALEYDRLSTLHLAILTVAFIFWLGLCAMERRRSDRFSFAARATSLAGWTVAGLAALWTLKPGLFTAQLSSSPALYVATRYGKIRESQTVYTPGSIDAEGVWAAIEPIIFYYGFAAIGLLALLHLLFRPQSKQRALWVYLTSALAVALLLLLYRGKGLTFRDAPLIGLILMFPYTHLVMRVLERLGGLNGPVAAPLRATALAGLVAWPLVMVISGGQGGGATESPVAAPGRGITETCKLTAMAHFLGNSEPWRDSPQRIMTLADFGPEIMYRTKHSVYSIPNHRPQSGYIDTVRVMIAPDDETARQILLEREVDLLLLCRSPSLSGFYAQAAPSQKATATYFRDRLLAAEIPPWLRAVPLPASLDERFRLFEVSRPTPKHSLQSSAQPGAGSDAERQ